MSAITQHSTSQALQRALEAQPGGKDGRWSANDEAAAMGGVIDFLQKYMKRGGKIQVDGKEKMKGQAARLALTALDFANKCGGLTLSLHGGVVAEDDAEDTSQEEDAAATAAVAHTNSQLRKHDKAVREELVQGKRLYGRRKYLEEYKLRIYYKKQHDVLDKQATAAEGNVMKDLVLSAIGTKRQDLTKEKLKCEKLVNRLNKDIEKAEQCLIRDEHKNILLQPVGSTLTVPLPKEIVMVDENGKEYVPPLQDGVVDDAANNDAVGLGTPEPKKQRTE